MKTDTVRPSVFPAEESPKFRRKRDGRNTLEGVFRRLGLPKPSPKHSRGFSPLNYVARCVGGKSQFMELARLSPDVRVRRLVSVWDRASRSDRRYLSVEGLAEACGVEQAELFGAVVTACYENGIDTSRLLGASYSYLLIVEALIKGGLRAKGHSKRKRLLRQIGLLA